MTTKKDTSLTIKLEGDLKRQFLDALNRDRNRDRSISNVLRDLMEAYIDLVNRYPDRKLPPFRLCGFEDEVKKGPIAPSFLKVAERSAGYHSANSAKTEKVR